MDVEQLVLCVEVANFQVLKGKLCRAGRDFCDAVTLVADCVSLWVAISSQLIMGCSCQRVLDNQTSIVEQLHGVEYGATTHLELGMLLHELHEVIDGEDAVSKLSHTQNLVPLRSLAQVMLFHILRQSVAQWSKWKLLLVHTKVQIYKKKNKEA